MEKYITLGNLWLALQCRAKNALCQPCQPTIFLHLESFGMEELTAKHVSKSDHYQIYLVGSLYRAAISISGLVGIVKTCIVVKESAFQILFKKKIVLQTKGEEDHPDCIHDKCKVHMMEWGCSVQRSFTLL